MFDGFDRNAPILPGKQLGGFKLYTHLRDYFDVIRAVTVKGGFRGSQGTARLETPYHVRYDLYGCVTLVFNMLNGKLYKIIAKNGYNGLLMDHISIGMPLSDAKAIHPIVYDDYEEVYKLEGINGLAIEVDPVTRKLEHIIVHIVELNNPESYDKSDKGLW